MNRRPPLVASNPKSHHFVVVADATLTALPPHSFRLMNQSPPNEPPGRIDELRKPDAATSRLAPSAESASYPSEVNQCGWKRSIVPAITTVGGIAVVLVVWTWTIGGRALAERMMTDLAMPVGLLWLMTLAASIASYRCGRRAIAATTGFVFLFVSLLFNPMFAGGFFRSTELTPDSDPIQSLEQPLDTVVLLGGYARRNLFGTSEISTDGHRLVTTAQLWHSGMTKSIICTGSAHIGDNHPSVIGKELLTSIGVPEAVILEIPGENTSQEMQSLKKFLADPPEQWKQLIEPAKPRIGLVTSAYHMKRAIRLARAQGLDLIPVPCGFKSTNDAWTPRMLVPNAEAGVTMAIVCKTFLAFLVGR